MAKVVPLIGAVAGAAIAGPVGGFLGSSLLGSVAGAVVATGINVIGSRALTKKPKQPSFSTDAQGRTTMVRSSVESHKIVYGTAKLSGPLVYVTTTNSGPNSAGQTVTGDNKFLHLVIALAGHEVEDIPTVYFNDIPVSLDGGGWVTTAPYSYATQSTSQTSVAVTTASHTGSTRTYTTAAAHGYSIGDSVSVSGFAPDRTWNGVYIVDSTPTATTFTVTESNLPTSATSTGGGTATKSVTTTATGSYARIFHHFGSDSQAADARLISECGWTAAHQLKGIAYIYVRLEWNPEVFPTGIPNISAVVKGKKVYDPRTTLTAWSDNWALCVRDYLASDYGFNAASGEINDAYFTAAANIADESVALKAGGTEARYTCNGVVDTAAGPLDNLANLLTAGAGAVTYVQGQFRLHAAAYDSSSGELNLGMLAGEVQLDARVSRKELFNAVRGTYVDPDKLWQATDFPPVTNATYEAQDNGEQIFKDFELPFTTGAERAQRLAKIALEKGRQGIRVTLPVNHSALKYSVYDVVTLTNAYLGWDAKPFRIMKWAIQFPGPILLSLQEESSASYDWNSGEATTIDAAPDTNLPNPFVVSIPVGVSAASGTDQLSIAGDGTVISRILVRWSPSTDSFVRSGGATQVQFKRADLSEWQDAPPPVGDSTQTFIAGVDDGEPYDIRVRFRNSLGSFSPWSAISHKVVGKSEPPSNVTVFTVEGKRFTWTHVTDVDVAGYRIRYQPGVNRSWGNAIPMHTGLLTHSPFVAEILPSGSATIMIKAVDASGNESGNPAVIVANLGDALVANVVETFDLQVAGWPGALTGGSIDGSNHLAATSTTLMWNSDASAAMWGSDSTALMWHASSYLEMQYEDRITVTGALDGSQMTLSADVAGDPWMIEYRENSPALMWDADGTTPMWDSDDSMLMWDTPDWLPWPGSVTARNSIYDVRITTGAGLTQGVVSAFTVTLDAPDVEETFDDVTIASGGQRLALTKTFQVIKNIQLTVQSDGGGALTARYDDKDAALGPYVRCLDAAGLDTAGTLDARIQGY